MDDINIFAKNEKKFKSLIWTIRIFSEDVGMKFGIEKSTMIIIKNRKSKTTVGTDLPNQEGIRTLGEKKNYKYLGILGFYQANRDEKK